MMISEQEQEQRKQRIIHTAFRLFSENGITAVPMTMIARESGVSEASVYRYFKTKVELTSCTQAILWREVVEHMMEMERDKLLAAKNGFEEVAVLLLGFRDLYKAHANYLMFAYDYKLFLYHQHAFFPASDYLDLLEPVRMMFLEPLQRGQADGSITLEESASNLYQLIWGLMRGFVEQIVVYDAIYDAENPFESQFDLVMQHILRLLK